MSPWPHLFSKSLPNCKHTKMNMSNQTELVLKRRHMLLHHSFAFLDLINFSFRILSHSYLWCWFLHASQSLFLGNLWLILKNKEIFSVFMCCCVSRAGKAVLVFFRWYDKLSSPKILCSGDYYCRKHERTLEYITRTLCSTYMYVSCVKSKISSINIQIILLQTLLTVSFCCPQSQKKICMLQDSWFWCTIWMWESIYTDYTQK